MRGDLKHQAEIWQDKKNPMDGECCYSAVAKVIKIIMLKKEEEEQQQQQG